MFPVDDAWRAGCGQAGQDTCEALLAELPPVLVLGDGTAARITEDVQIFQGVDDPVTTASAESVAIETQFQGLTRWWLVTRQANGTVVAAQADPALSSVGFDEWVNGLDDPARKPGEQITLPPA